jgi:hypothetical protein
VIWRVASVSKTDLAGLAGELDEVCDMLIKTTDTLAAFKLIDGSRLKDVKKLPGYRPLASDVAAMVELIRERWDVVQGKCPLTFSDLDRFAAKALDLLAGVGIKDQQPVTTGEAALNRQRAFTLFHRAYEEARRAVLYLRPTDGDSIAPSLYAGRGGRPRGIGASSDGPSSGTVSTGGGANANPTLTVNNPTGLPRNAAVHQLIRLEHNRIGAPCNAPARCTSASRCRRRAATWRRCTCRRITSSRTGWCSA